MRACCWSWIGVLLLASVGCSSRDVPAIDIRSGPNWDCRSFDTTCSVDTGTDAPLDMSVPPDVPPLVKCDTTNIGKMCTKSGSECGATGTCLLTGKLASGTEVGVCTCPCVVDESVLPSNPPTYVCPGDPLLSCGQWEDKTTGKKRPYCLKPCWPKLGIRSCEGKLACLPRSGALVQLWEKALCLLPGCFTGLDCPVRTHKTCSVAKKDCPVGQRCVARVEGLDPGLCAKPGKCDVASGLCDTHALCKATAKVGDPCKDDTECAGNMTCLMPLDEGNVLRKAGETCTADAHCCSGRCTGGACAAGKPCRLIRRNGYCAITGCLHAKTYTIRACDTGSTCNRLWNGGRCFKTCDLNKAPTCRGVAGDRLGDYECRAWHKLNTSGGVVAKVPVCEPAHLISCDIWKPPPGSSSTLSCAHLGTWDGTTNSNKTQMACRDLAGTTLKDTYDPAGLCLDVTASGPPAQ